MFGSPTAVVTLANRLGDDDRSVTDQDLRQIADFLAETLGSWYNSERVRPPQVPVPPSVRLTDILVVHKEDDQSTQDEQVTRRVGSAAVEKSVGGLVDDGESLSLVPPTLPTELQLVFEADDPVPSGSEPAPRGAVATGNDGGPDSPSERDGVRMACETLAEAAAGRRRRVGESWEDVIEVLENESHASLAAALWVGLAAEPEARYKTLEHWHRAVTTALSSDAVTADLFARLSGRIDPEGRAMLTGAVLTLFAVAIVATIGGVSWLGYQALSDDSDRVATDAEAAGPATAEADPDGGEPSGPNADGGEPSVEQSAAAGSNVNDRDETTALDGLDADGDGRTTVAAGTTLPRGDGSSRTTPSRPDLGDERCVVVGPLGALTVEQITDRAIVVGWEPAPHAVDILVDSTFLDTVPPESSQYVIERLPLSGSPLATDTLYIVDIRADERDPSRACATTESAPLAEGEELVGVFAPTGLAVIDQTPTSLTIGWDLRPGADLHNLFLDGRYVQYGDVGGSTAVGDETDFTFIGLDPDTTYEIGIRRVEGFNQSGLVTITAATPP